MARPKGRPGAPPQAHEVRRVAAHKTADPEVLHVLDGREGHLKASRNAVAIRSMASFPAGTGPVWVK